MIPMLLLILAMLSAILATFGTLPGWTQYHNGLDFIVFTRHYYWLMIGLSLLMCMSVVVLVALGKRRVWWLFGLAPVMALYMYGVANNPMRGFAVLDADDSQFEKAALVKDVGDDDWVLGLELDGQAYAYPYSRIYSVPVIVQNQQEKRFALIWSPFANHAVARRMTLDLHARDIELVSMPANMTLVFDRKYGQFISGANGMKLDGGKANGIGADIPVHKTTFKQWKAEHKDTLVLKTPSNDPGGIPSQPLKPYYPVPQPSNDELSQEDLSTPICVVPTTRPFAILNEDLSARPANLDSPDGQLLIFRDEKTGKVRAFSRIVDSKPLQFVLNKNTNRQNVYMEDAETRSGWSISGVALDGPMAENNQRLTPLPVAEGCYWGVMRFWMSKRMGLSDLVLLEPDFKPASLSGKVFVDLNNDGDKQTGEQAVSQLKITCRGKDNLGYDYLETAETNASGVYEFKDLRPGVYSLTLRANLAGYKPGKKTLGVAGGKTTPDSGAITEINLKSGVVAMYNFPQVKR